MSGAQGTSREAINNISSEISTMRVKEAIIDSDATTSTSNVRKNKKKEYHSSDRIPRSNTVSSSSISTSISTASDAEIVVPKTPIEVVYVATSKDLDLRDKLLSKFFRCHEFPTACTFHSNDLDEFSKHLQEKHASSKKLKCHYCGPRDSKTFQDDRDALIQHIMTIHAHRRFQCNLCLYRGSYLLQIHLHFIDCHTENYDMLTHKTMPLSGPSLPSSINRTAPATQKLALPRVLLCPVVCNAFPILKESLIFAARRVDRINRYVEGNVNRDYIQCVYCKFVHKNKNFVLFHLSKAHTDWPVLYYPSGTSEQPMEEEPVMTKHQESESRRQPESRASTSAMRETESAISGVGGLPCRRTTIEHVVDSPPRHKMFHDWNDDDDDDMFLQEDDPLGDDLREDLRLSDGEKSDGNTAVDDSIDATKKRNATPYRASVGQTPKKARSSVELNDEDVFGKEERDVLAQMRKKGIHVEKELTVQPIQVIPTAKNPGAKKKKCLFPGCNPLTSIFLESKTEFHMQSQHKTVHTMKCEDCEMMGTKVELKKHIREDHKGNGRVVCVIVPVDDQMPLVVDIVGTPKDAPKGVKMIELQPLKSVRKSTAVGSRPKTPNPRRRKSEIPPKGHLMENLTERVDYRGPSKNEKTDRARRQSGRDAI